MESTLPIIEAEVVVFHANKRCLEDLGLFKKIRDMVAATTRYVQPAQTKKAKSLTSLCYWNDSSV